MTAEPAAKTEIIDFKNIKTSYTEAQSHRVEPLPVEPYDKVWGIGISGNTKDPSPFPRINRILERTPKSTNGEVDATRALKVTEAYKAHESDPHILQVAWAMYNHFTTSPIEIYEDELLVGTLGAPIKAGPVFPEFGVDWIVQEMKEGLMDYSEQRTHDYFWYTDETVRKLEGIQDYWRGKSVSDVALSLLSDEELKGSHVGKQVFSNVNYFTSGPGHLGINYDYILKKGFGKIRQEIQEKLDSLDICDPEDFKKIPFYKAMLVANEGGSIYIKRHADLAREKAAAEENETRAKELLKIAEVCDHISEGAPRTFYEAIQMVLFANDLVLMESNGHSISYGRFDQYMYPFYKHDIETGEADRPFMQELIENFMIKIWELNKLRDHNCVAIFGNGGIGGPCLTLGGLKADGTDGTNDVTFMFLDAHAHTRIVNPWIAARMHNNSPREYKVKVANVIRIGTGEPKIFNDEVTVPSMMTVGRTIEEARDYQVVGCVEPDVPGQEYGWKDAGYLNIAKVLELAINDGRCIECGEGCPRWGICGLKGKQLGIKTGSLADFTSFDQVKEAYDKQMKYWCDKMAAVLCACDYAQQTVKPLPFLSTIMEGCLESGKDVSAGGAKRNFVGTEAVGIGTVGDGLSTIKQLVFDEKKVTGRELLDAIRANWEGYEALYALVNSDKVHHYGNDDPYADELTKFGLDVYFDHMEGRPTMHGGVYTPGVYCSVGNVDFGSKQWASVEGRKAGEPVSDNCGAVHTFGGSHDTKGPLAICRSVTQLSHIRATNGTLLNWKFSPTVLEGDTGRDSLIALIEEYVKRKGTESQFTIASQETLKAAQKDPDNYRDLTVRIAGYSAYFVEMCKGLQDDIIGRTGLEF